MKTLFTFIIVTILSFITLYIPNLAHCSTDCPYVVQDISTVHIKGNSRINENFIISYLQSTSSTCLSISEASPLIINTLFSTGLFKSISLSSSETELTVTVQENPLLKSIEINGMHELKSSEIQQVISLEQNRVLSDFKLKQSVSSIIELYKRHGFFFTSIEQKIIPVEDDSQIVNIILNITEGERSKVKGIRFVGNNNYDSYDLKSLLRSKTSTWLSFLTKSDVFDSAKIAVDEEILRTFYHSRGYADFSVISTVTELSPNSTILTFVINEGEIHHIKEIQINNSVKSIETSEIESIISISPGDTFNLQEIYALSYRISNYLNKLNSDIKVDLDYEQFENNITVKFIIKENDPRYIDRITIKGNSRTNDSVIRKEILLQEGDLFTENKLLNSERRLSSLGFFESVTITPITHNTFKDKVDLLIEVKEKSTGDIGLSGGYSNTQGIIANLNYTERNLFGTGTKLSLGMQKATSQISLDAAFEKPYIINNITGSISTHYISNNNPSISPFTAQHIGGSAALRSQIKQNTYYSIKYLFNTTQIKDVSIFASRSIKEQEGKTITSALNHMIAYNSLDSDLNPHDGVFLSLSQDFAGLGGNTKYLKSDFSASLFQNNLPIPILHHEEVVLKLSSSVGHILNYNDRPLRTTERFTLQDTTMRGFKSGGIGPRDTTNARTSNGVELKGTALGGQMYSVSTAQINFPLPTIQKLNFRGSFFLDAGTVFGIESKAVSNIEPHHIKDSSAMRLSAGMGIVWLSPFGPMRLNLAAPIVKEDFDEVKLISFSMGTIF